ncbi:MAG: ornithine cyclodeaminase family protein [Gemmatimonadales bacterium]|nr:ornithine cyclodeaminase family protein [Gemmatimonadales bacterium]
MSPPTLLYLSRADVESCAVDMRTAIALLETAFREKGNGRAEMPPKPGIHPRAESFIHAMPAHIPALRAAGIKWVAGYPENPRRGLPYVSGLVILNDDETGLPTCVMDCTWLTGCRTGAATALSARHLARPESAVAGILGCGVQGRTNLEALAAIFPLRRALAYDSTAATASRYAEEMQARLGIEVSAVSSAREAVADSDLVVTAGSLLKDPSPTIGAGWLRPGAFASAVDFDSYWTPEALAELDHLSTDDHAQFQYYRGLGYFRGTPDPHSDLGELVAGTKAGRQAPGERTMAMNLGLALDDMAVAPEVERRARSLGIGIELAR